jgi:hypothetical protein
MILPLLLFAALAQAHKQSDSYLSIDASAGSDTVGMRWDIALRDLDFALGLDADASGALTWGEIRSRREAIEDYAFRHLSVAMEEGGTRCALTPGELLIDDHVDGAYAVLQFAAHCPAVPRTLAVHYSLLFDLDPNHHGLLNLRTASFNQSMVFKAEAPSLTLNLARADGWAQLRSFVAEGIWHIWHGYDHILFLLTLLLPAVVVRRQHQWLPRESWREAGIDILKVVTAFTLSHSLTLSLAVLGFIQAPSRLVESAIAITVLLGALNILFPLITARRWVVALVFGLIHGLGFAAVLADLGLTAAGLLKALVGFNLGVEIGQIAIVLLVMPLLYAVRGTWFYRRAALPAGACVIALLALYWVVSRAVPGLLPPLLAG